MNACFSSTLKHGSRIYDDLTIKPQKRLLANFPILINDSIYQLTQYLQGSIESNAIAEPTAGKAWTYDVMGNWLGTEEAMSFSDDFEMKPWHHYGWNHSWNHGSWSHDRQNNRGRGYGHGWSWGHNNNNPKDEWKTHLDEFVSNYEIVSGEWKLQPKRLFCRARNEKSILLLNSENLTDPTLQVDLSECGSFLNNGGAGFIFAYQNADNYCFAGVGNSIMWQSWSKENKHGKGGKGHGHAVPCKTFVIGKVANGQGEILASDSKEISWWNRHRVESVKLTVSGTQIDLALINRRSGEAETVLSHTCEIAVPEGKVGLGVHSSGRRSETATFDDFQVKALIIDKNEYNSANALVLKDGKVFLYDADGNMIDDSSKTYTWDVFNRLTSVTMKETGVVIGEYSYDYLNRRVSRQADLDADGVMDVDMTYAYDGWNICETVTAAGETTSYVWGNDLSGSTQGAGGVGGLLSVTNADGTYTTCNDANGNVTAYADATGKVVSKITYKPFGGAEVEGMEFTHMFSTKPYDTETGLYYSLNRYYDPELGRWISRDSIEEEGGYLLYGYCLNNPVTRFDYLGYDDGIDKKAARDLWKDVINYYLIPKGWHVAAFLLNYSLQDNPKNPQLSKNNFIISKIRSSKEYETFIKNIINSKPNGYSKVSGVKVISFDSGDLFAGIHEADIVYSGDLCKKNIYSYDLKMKVDISDEYDFKFIWGKYYTYNLKRFLAIVANNLAALDMISGVINEYQWRSRYDENISR